VRTLICSPFDCRRRQVKSPSHGSRYGCTSAISPASAASAASASVAVTGARVKLFTRGRPALSIRSVRARRGAGAPVAASATWVTQMRSIS